MTEEKGQEESKISQQEKPKSRQIVIEFDAQKVGIVSGQISSNFELIGILETLLEQIKPKN